MVKQEYKQRTHDLVLSENYADATKGPKVRWEK